MKVKYQVCSPNFVLKKKGKGKKKKTYRHIILLDSIKWLNNFVLKINLTTRLTQIKLQILTQKRKKIILNPHVYI